MDCKITRNQLGPYLDDELPSPGRHAVEAHLAACPACAEELAALRVLAGELAPRGSDDVPEALWDAINERLDHAAPDRLRQAPFRPKRPIFRRPLAAAASILLVIGIGVLGIAWFQGGASPVEASTIDFSTLLDALPLDAPKAFRRFLIRYHALPTSVHGARRYAPHLNFAIPESLPGGFELKRVYTLRFGKSAGVAAEYTSRRGGFLATVFHQPVSREDFGGHRSYPCVIGEHCGHTVKVGPWQLVHLTDPSTCHCVLSKLDARTELPAVMAAVAPDSPAWDGEPHHH